jgi:signal transduction histidine kinase
VTIEREDVRELIDRAVYEERDRIARDLHDLVIQRLFAIGLGISALERQQTKPEQLRGYVADIDQTIADIRRSIFFLQQRPNTAPSLRGEVLRIISDATASLGYEPTVRLEGPLDSVVPPEVHLDLIATLRETLSNVVRHARARSVSVTVTVDRTASSLELLVHDDGCGLPSEIGHRSGLANIVARARRLSGFCRVSSPPDAGTRVLWVVPLTRLTRAFDWYDPDSEAGVEQLEATS